MKYLKMIFLFSALFFLGEKYIPHELSPFNWNNKGETIWIIHYIIGDENGKVLFTIPKAESGIHWLTPEQAEAYNKAIEPTDTMGGS